MKRYHWVDTTAADSPMFYVDADEAEELWVTVKAIASLYKSDIIPSDDYCWDEVVEMCRKTLKEIGEEDYK